MIQIKSLYIPSKIHLRSADVFDDKNIVRKGLLNKVKKTGVYQYLYSVTAEFNVAIECVKLIEATPKSSCQLVSSATNHEHRNVNIQIKSLIEKYSSELAKVSGAKEIYEELIVAVPSRENEFRKLSLEQDILPLLKIVQ